MAAQRRQTFSQVYLTMLAIYLGQVSGISVTFGTSGGPIIPPTPSPPTPPPRPPYRAPAPVWEETDDIPNPNPYKAPVPPQLAHIFTTKTPSSQSTTTLRPPGGQTRYTQVVYSQPKPAPPPPASTLSAAQSFVKAYAQPTKTAPTQGTYQNNQNQNNQHDYNNHNEENYQNIEKKSGSAENYNSHQVPELGIRYIPGYGFKYFTPEQDKDPRKFFKSNKYFHDKHNSIESNNIFESHEHPHDLDLSYDKILAQRIKKSPQQTFVPQQPFTYYHHPQLFFPNNYVRH